MTTEITTTCINPGCDDETDHLVLILRKVYFIVGNAIGEVK